MTAPKYNYTAARMKNGKFSVALFEGDPAKTMPVISSLSFEPKGFDTIAEAVKQCKERVEK